MIFLDEIMIALTNATFVSVPLFAVIQFYRGLNLFSFVLGVANV